MKRAEKKVAHTKYQLGLLAGIYMMAQAVFHAPRGNSKLGAIPAWNLAPVMTCSAEACAHCAQTGCYAVKDMFRHGYNYETNSTMRAWMDNTKLAKTDLPALEKQLDALLTIRELKVDGGRFFRIHSAGDFFSVEYMTMWGRLARKHKKIKFLAFTKQFAILREHDADLSNTPFYAIDNFSMVLSGWTGIEIPEDLKEHYRCAYCVEHGDVPPEGALECPGACETCGMCWSLKDLQKDTFFWKH